MSDEAAPTTNSRVAEQIFVVSAADGAFIAAMIAIVLVGAVVALRLL